MNIVFTVCNRSQLPNAIALGMSVLKYNADYTFYIGWADTLPLPVLPAGLMGFSVETANIPDWGQMCARYYDFELIPASRPWFARAIIKANPDCTRLLFLSATTQLYGSLQEILPSKSELLLTPNISKPLNPSEILDDKRILNVGMFHAGSWAIKPSVVTMNMLNWWAHRTIDRAKFDLCNGMCMDQLWLNYGPVWVPDTKQVDHPGWHYGLHAILNKSLGMSDGVYTVDGENLITIDFAGLTHFDPVWSDHIELAGLNTVFQRLFKEYLVTVKSFDKGLPKGTPGYGKVPQINEKRLVRKNIVNKLKSITKFIDQYEVVTK